MDRGKMVVRMEDMEFRQDSIAEELKAIERELDAARHLNRQLRDAICEARKRDQQVLIERRRKPR